MCWWTLRLCFLLNCVYFLALFNLFPAFFLLLLLCFIPFLPLFCFYNSFHLLCSLLSFFNCSAALFRFLLFLNHLFLFLVSSISYPFIYSFLILYILFILCPYSFLYLLYLPALQFNKCICMTSVVVIILLMCCLSLCSLLLECLDAWPHVPKALYHLLIYFP